MNAHRSPAPRRIASSTPRPVATSSFTSHSASRHIASISRSAMNPSISVRTCRGDMPTADSSSAARAMVLGDVCVPPHSSTSGSRYTGLNGCADAEPLRVLHVGRIRDGSRPEVEEA